MASKPLIALARWADLVGSFVADPSSGERDTGFEDGNPAEADKVNALLLQLYLWALYLDGAVLSGSHAIDGSFTVGGQPLVFADFTYTADVGTDTLTKTAHGLETGDGQVRTTNSGGGLPGGLAAGTDYFVIKTGANTFKLATTRALALAGTAIDITSAGTGTHTLIDQAGTTRVTDATVTRNLTVDGATTAGAVTASGLVTANAGVTAGVNQHITVSGTGEIKHGDRTPAFAACSLATVQSGTATFTLDGEVVYTGITLVLYFIPLSVGDRLKSITFTVTGDNTVDGNIDVRKKPALGAASSIIGGGTSVLTNVSTTEADVVVDITDTTLAAGDAVILVIESTAAGLIVGNIRPTFDHP
jgi:hypothetical protein